MAVLLLFLSAFLSDAQTMVFFDLGDGKFNQNPASNRVVQIRNLSPFPGNWLWKTSDVNGQFYFSNALQTTYSGTILAPPAATPFSFSVTATNLGVIPATSITSIPSPLTPTFPAGQTAWSIQAADARYLFNTNTSGAAPLTAAQTTNLVASAIPTNFWSSSATLWISNLISIGSLNTNQYAAGTLLSSTTNSAGLVTFTALPQTNGFSSIVSSNALMFANTNQLFVTSNALAGQIGSAGIPAVTATNIATNQVFLGTNALAISSGLAAFRPTNSFDAAGIGLSAATASTNGIGIASGLSAFVSTNLFDVSGAATAATNAAGISSGLSAYVSTNRFDTNGAAATAQTTSQAYADTNNVYKVPIAPSLSISHPGNINLERVVPYEAAHATVKVNNKLYAGASGDGIYVINDPDGEMNSITSTSLPPVFQCCYIPATGLIYFITTNSVISVNPANIASQTTIATGYNFGQGTICTDGTNLFAGSFSTNYFYKISPLGVLLGSNSWAAAIHGSGFDPIHGVVIFTTASGVIAKVNPTTLTFSSASIGGLPTDDFAILSNFVYVGSETDDNIRKVNLTDLTCTTNVADRSYGIFTDGTNIFNTSRDALFVFYPNADLTKPYRYAVGIQPNELWITDTGRLIITDFEDALVYRMDVNIQNLGAGTISPAYNLDLRGDFRADAATVNSLNFSGDITGQNFSVDRRGLASVSSLSAAGPGENDISPIVIDTLGNETSTGGLSFYDSVNDAGAALFLSNAGETLTIDDEANFPFTDVWVKKPLRATSFAGSATGMTNVINGPTVTAGSGATVALSRNANGSTNYQIALSGTVVALTNADTRPWTNASVSGIWSTNLGDGANTNLVGANVGGNLFPISLGSGLAYDVVLHVLSSSSGAFAVAASNSVYQAKVSATNGFSTNQIASGIALEANLSFGATGQATNIFGSSPTNYLLFINAGESSVTNGPFVLLSALNLYTNFISGDWATNNGSATLVKSNTVTLYSLAGANPIGTYSAISGVAPSPTSVATARINANNFAWDGFLSPVNLNAVSNAIIAAGGGGGGGSNFVAILNGFGTNTSLTTLTLPYGTIYLPENSGRLTNFIVGSASAYSNSVPQGFMNIILGGQSNAINNVGFDNIIIGGKQNVIGGTGNSNSVIIGGISNNIVGAVSDDLVLGQVNNISSGGFCNAIGSSNQISTSSYSTAIGQNNTLFGGNEAIYDFMIGWSNTISAYQPWFNFVIGVSNSVSGPTTSSPILKNSFALGTMANATNNSVFIWGDGTAPVFSRTNNSFLINSANGVGINTNWPAGFALNVNGAINATSLSINDITAVSLANTGNLTNQGNVSIAGSLTNFGQTYLRTAMSAASKTNWLFVGPSGQLLTNDFATLAASIAGGGGAGTVSSVDVALSGFTSSGAVTSSGTVTLTRTADIDNLGLGQTNMGFLKVTNTASIGGQVIMSALIITNGVTNIALTASTLLEADANKKLTSLANGAGVLTNDTSGDFGYLPLTSVALTNQLLPVLGTPTSIIAAFDSAGNLVGTNNGIGLTNWVAYTHEGTTTNINIAFNGTLQSFTVTNGPDVWLNWSGANGSASVQFLTNCTIHSTTTFGKFLAGSNGVSAGAYKITNGWFVVTSAGGTNSTQLAPAIVENQ